MRIDLRHTLSPSNPSKLFAPPFVIPGQVVAGSSFPKGVKYISKYCNNSEWIYPFAVSQPHRHFLHHDTHHFSSSLTLSSSTFVFVYLSPTRTKQIRYRLSTNTAIKQWHGSLFCCKLFGQLLPTVNSIATTSTTVTITRSDLLLSACNVNKGDVLSFFSFSRAIVCTSPYFFFFFKISFVVNFSRRKVYHRNHGQNRNLTLHPFQLKSRGSKKITINF